MTAPGNTVPASARLFDPTRGVIRPRNPFTGSGGLRKPSLRVPEVGGRPNRPNYLVNTNPDDVTPSNENDYVRDRNVAAALGKALFWDMQVGSDGVQACGTCHFTGAGIDTRTKNQINPNHLGARQQLRAHAAERARSRRRPTSRCTSSRTRTSPATPRCTTPIVADVSAVRAGPPGQRPAGSSATQATSISDVNDVVSSMGVVFNKFTDIAPIGQFRPAHAGVQAVVPDLRTAGGNELDPIPGFQGFRRVEPRNTPTMQAAGFNFDNFWDGRARHDFNGGSVFGASTRRPTCS